MNGHDFIQLALYIGLLVALTPPLGRFMARVFNGERNLLTPALGPAERLIYELCGVIPAREMSWTSYAAALLAFNLAGFLLTLAQLMTQAWLPLNPAHLPNVPFPLALNTAVSFMTNTNWQAYSGEATMSHLSQMTGLAVHNFTSAATGIAAMLALVRGLTRKGSAGFQPASGGILPLSTLGNFWADLTRSTLHILPPLSLVFGVFIAGLMVGRTPEYLGKKIEAAEIKWAVVAVLAPCVLILIGTAVGVSGAWGLSTLNNAGPHGLSEVPYAFSSAAGNNGSAFAGLGVNTDFYNYSLAAAMLLGRFAVIIPALAIVGSKTSRWE